MRTMVVPLSSILVLAALAGAEEAPRAFDDIVTTKLVVLPYDIIELHDKDTIFGELVEVKPQDSIRFRRQGSNIIITTKWDKVKDLQQRKTAEQVVRERGEQLIAALDHGHLRQAAENEVIRLHKWAAEREVLAAARPAVLAAHAGNPENPILLEATVDLLLALNDDEELERVLRRGVASKPTWRRGFEELAKLLRRGDRQDELRQLAAAWIEHQPTNATANRLMARIAEEAGDVSGAQEAYRKLYAHHDQAAAGLQYVRISLRRGNHRQASRVVEEMLVSHPEQPGLAVVAGATYLATGEIERAKALLLDGTASTGDDPELTLLRDYNRAWLLWREGRRQEARAIWGSLDHPVATLALSLAQRRPVRDRALLQDPILGPVARELNACLMLEREQPQQARQLIGEPDSERLLTLDRIAAMQASAYAAEAVARLADRRSRDAVLWRAYGLIKNGAFERALTVLDHLEEDDGYAAVYRLFCHEALGDEEAAAAWYQKALASDDAPRRYLDHLTAFYYRSKNDREMHEPFDWPAGEVLDVGWFREAKGTNITIRATGEALAFQGVQTASREPISRAWCVRPRDHVRRVAATVHAGETQGAVGLELLDETRSNGLAVAVIDGGALHWRRLRDGVWETWEQLLTSPPTTWAVWIDPQQEGEKQVQLMTTREHIPMTSLFDLPGGMLCIGFFVEAPAGAVVDATVDDLRIQLHREQPADGQQAPAEGAAPGASRGRR